MSLGSSRTGWDRQLEEAPEQPVLFFFRGGHWRWWSSATFAGAVATVADSAASSAQPARVAHATDWPHLALAVDLGLRRSGRESVPWLDPEGETGSWTCPDLERSEGDLPLDAIFPETGSGFCSWRGRVVALPSDHLRAAAELLEVELAPHLAGVAGPPLALAAGSMASAETLIWCWWAALRGAVLLLLRDRDDLVWATSWARPHLVLGTGSELELAVAHHAVHGAGRRPSGLRRRFERLRLWVELVEPGEEPLGEAGLGAVWPRLGVHWLRFPDLSPILP